MPDRDFISNFYKSNINEDRRYNYRRAEDQSQFCVEHHSMVTKLDDMFNYFKTTDDAHEASMEKLEKQINNVDKKVDDLKNDLPKIITTSVEDAFKTGVWIGVKKFIKLILGIALFTLATAIVMTLAPDFADFLQEIGNNIGR